MVYVFMTYEGLSLPIAYKMQAEGSRVLVGQIQDQKELKVKNMNPEKGDEKARRLSLYDGLLEKKSAKQLVDKLKAVPDKDEYFIFFDFNNLWRYSEELLEVGFTKGMFPLAEDWHFEEDRMAAKEYVKQNYSHMKVAEVYEFSTVKDGLTFLKKDKNLYVLKSKGNNGRTVVPQTNDLHLAFGQLEEALKEDKKNYEKDGFVLERMIVNIKECIVEQVWYDGQPVYAIADLENKYFGSGNLGTQVGCAMGLRYEIPMSCRAMEMAFPKSVYTEAKRRWGMFVWDAGILWDEDEEEYYFTEFCPNRVGYDSFFAELEMSGGPTSYFEALQEGKNPIRSSFGATSRIFNIHKEDDGTARKDAPVVLKGSKGELGTWMYDIKQTPRPKKIVTAGYEMDLGVASSASHILKEAVANAYRHVSDDIFLEGMYYRPQFDFESLDYPTSIYNRYKFFEDQKIFKEESKKMEDVKDEEVADSAVSIN